MKKTLVLGASVLLLAGCGSKIKCSQEIKEGGKTIKASIIANVKKDKIKDFSVEYKLPSKSDAEKVCKVMSKAKCSGKTVKLEGDDALSMIGLSKDRLKNTSKEDFKKGMEQSGYKCK